jgi:hypothetical protein
VIKEQAEVDYNCQPSGRPRYRQSIEPAGNVNDFIAPILSSAGPSGSDSVSILPIRARTFPSQNKTPDFQTESLTDVASHPAGPLLSKHRLRY